MIIHDVAQLHESCGESLIFNPQNSMSYCIWIITQWVWRGSGLFWYVVLIQERLLKNHIDFNEFNELTFSSCIFWRRNWLNLCRPSPSQVEPTDQMRAKMNQGSIKTTILSRFSWGISMPWKTKRYEIIVVDIRFTRYLNCKSIDHEFFFPQKFPDQRFIDIRLQQVIRFWIFYFTMNSLLVLVANSSEQSVYQSWYIAAIFLKIDNLTD